MMVAHCRKVILSAGGLGPGGHRASLTGAIGGEMGSSQLCPYFRGNRGAQHFDGAKYFPVKDPGEVHLQDLSVVAEDSLKCNDWPAISLGSPITVMQPGA